MTMIVMETQVTIIREKAMEIKIRRMKKLRLYLILIYLRIIGPLPAIMI